MNTNAFGYEVLTLDEIIAQLSALREIAPELGDQPVWLMNCPPLFWPVKQVQTSRTADGRYRTEIRVERGA